MIRQNSKPITAFLLLLASLTSGSPAFSQSAPEIYSPQIRVRVGITDGKLNLRGAPTPEGEAGAVKTQVPDGAVLTLDTQALFDALAMTSVSDETREEFFKNQNCTDLTQVLKKVLAGARVEKKGQYTFVKVSYLDAKGTPVTGYVASQFLDYDSQELSWSCQDLYQAVLSHHTNASAACKVQCAWTSTNSTDIIAELAVPLSKLIDPLNQADESITADLVKQVEELCPKLPVFPTLPELAVTQSRPDPVPTPMQTITAAQIAADDPLAEPLVDIDELKRPLPAISVTRSNPPTPPIPNITAAQIAAHDPTAPDPVVEIPELTGALPALSVTASNPAADQSKLPLITRNPVSAPPAMTLPHTEPLLRIIRKAPAPVAKPVVVAAPITAPAAAPEVTPAVTAPVAKAPVPAPAPRGETPIARRPSTNSPAAESASAGVSRATIDFKRYGNSCRAKVDAGSNSNEAFPVLAPSLKQKYASKGLVWGAPVYFRVKKYKDLENKPADFFHPSKFERHAYQVFNSETSGKNSGGVIEAWVESPSGEYVLLDSYDIGFFSGLPGPKRVEGDYQTPEGFYNICADRMKPDHPDYHMSMNIGFGRNDGGNNIFDQRRGASGGAVLIHGVSHDKVVQDENGNLVENTAYLKPVSAGCMSMQDDKDEELFLLAEGAINANQNFCVPVQIFPFDMTESNMRKWDPSELDALSNRLNKGTLPCSVSDFWSNMKQGYDYFETNHRLPLVQVEGNGCASRYTFKDAPRVQRKDCW